MQIRRQTSKALTNKINAVETWNSIYRNNLIAHSFGEMISILRKLAILHRYNYHAWPRINRFEAVFISFHTRFKLYTHFLSIILTANEPPLRIYINIDFQVGHSWLIYMCILEWSLSMYARLKINRIVY